MQFTISSGLLHGNIKDKITQTANAGFVAIDINRLDILSSDHSPEKIAALAQDAGLSIYKYQTIYNIEGQKGGNRIAAFSRLEFELDIAKKLGAELVLLGASTTIAPQTSGDDIINDLIEIATQGEKRDLKIAYLALPWATYDKTSKEAYARVQRVNHSSFGLALSSYFDLAKGANATKFQEFDGRKIFSVQLADAPTSEFDISHLKHEFACLPGLGDLNLISYIRSLVLCNYANPWSLAAMKRDTGVIENKAQNGYRAIINLFDNRRLAVPEKQLKPAKIPTRAKLHGYEYIEFALAKENIHEMQNFLSTLCFRLERKHRSKPVELWRQGAINIVLNISHDGFSDKVLKTSDPSLSEIGLRVDDAIRAQNRASMLGVEIFKQNVSAGNIGIPAINGVGQSIIRFIDENSKLHHVWDIEFQPPMPHQATQPAGLRRIDHIAQTMAHEKLDHWLLFFLSVFNMKKTPLVDIQDPAGIVYSRAIESPEGEVRLNLNGTSSDQTFSGNFLAKRHSASSQHIAFASDDIFETSSRLANSGFKRLQIPANYYASICAEYALDHKFLKSLQDGNILYSRNPTGEFFQIYSQSIWSGFFVEIVQRKKGYSGYGARNAPIRIAAQSREKHTND